MITVSAYGKLLKNHSIMRDPLTRWPESKLIILSQSRFYLAIIQKKQINFPCWYTFLVSLMHAKQLFKLQGSKFKFEFGSTRATRCQFLGAQLIVLGASISKEKVKSLTVPRLIVIFSLLLLLQSCG